MAAGAALGQNCAAQQSGFIGPGKDVGGSSLAPIILFRHTTIQVTLGNQVVTYDFDNNGVGGPFWEVTVNGSPYVVNGNEGNGIYNGADASEIASSICPNGVTRTASTGRPAAHTAAVAIPASGQAAGLYVSADFNGDGVLDTASASAGSVSITLYGPNATVLSTQRYTTGAPYAGEIVSADFNGDGIADLAVCILPNAPPGNVAVLLGKGDGTFGKAVLYPAGPGPIALAAVDLNGDGKMDLAVTNTIYASLTSTGTIDVLMGKGDGSFAAPVVYNAGQTPTSLIATDLNGDGKPDVAALDSQQGSKSDQLLVLLNDGTGTLKGTLPALVTGTYFGSLSYSDLNHDGKTDLLIADQRGSTLTVTMGNGDGTFQTPEPYVAVAGPASAGIIPLGDGNTAVLTGDAISNNIVMYFVAPDGTVGSAPVQTVGTSLSASAVSDLNGDGKADIVVADQGGNRLFVVLNSGSAGFASPVAYGVSSSPGGLAIADVNGDGKPDLLVSDTNGIEVLPGKGNGTFGTVQTSGVAGAGAGLMGLAVADFNGDGKPDVATSLSTGQVTVGVGQGNGTFTQGATISLPGASSPVAILSGDFNRDGKADLAVIYDLATGGALAILLGKGDGTFQAPAVIALPGYGRALAAGDLNKDGKLDLIAGVQETTGMQALVLLGNGDGTFQAPLANLTGTGLASISVVDVDGDGNPDLLLGDCCGLTEATYLLGKGDGTFQAEFAFPSGPNPSYFGVGDFNGDGKPDLAIAGNNHGHGTLVVLLNNFASTGAATVVSAANPNATAITPGSLATAYGADLATGTAGSTTAPWPASFGGSSVSIVDAAGATTAAPLVYVSAAQVNFLVPSTVAIGRATVTITSGDGTQSVAQVQVGAVAPGVFTLNGAGLAAAVGILVSASGAQTAEQVYAVNSAGAYVAAPISLGSASDQLVIELFGTGIAAAGTSGVTVTVAGVNLPVAYAGRQGTVDGLDQVNFVLPQSLAGKGAVSIQLTAAGIAANPTTITIQ